MLTYVKSFEIKYCCTTIFNINKSKINILAQPLALSIKENKIQIDDFDFIKVIGRGAFGEVSCF